MANQSLLSHDHYFSEGIFQAEKRALFQSGESDVFVGHTSMAPGRADYCVLPHTSNGKFIRNDGEKFSLIDNICRHRHALMLEGQGTAERIVCPIHMWSYDGQGAMVKSPGIDCDKAVHSLECEPLDIAHGFLVRKGDKRLKQSLQAAREFTDLDFEKMYFLGSESSTNPTNWKDYIETFLELYHVDAYHPGLRGMVDCNRLQNRFGDRWHLQAVEARDISLRNSSKKIAEFIKLYEQEVGEFDNGFGAIWLTIYPGTLIEIYGKFAVFAHVIPHGPSSYSVHKYTFCDPSLIGREGLIAEFSAFMNQVEVEDLDLIQKIRDGRRLMFERGDPHIGPVHPTKEDGQVYFHDYLRQSAYGETLSVVNNKLRA